MVLTIGPLTVDPPVVLAPMAGVTNAPFRRLCRSYGAGLYVNEMLAARALVEDGPRSRRMATFDPAESPRSAQVFAVDPHYAGLAVRRLVDDFGAEHVDLNFGCPVPKVTKRGGGAALPAHPVLFASIVRAAVAAAGPVPVTVKLRIGIDGRYETSLESGRIAAAEGAAAVTLHARTAEQLYSGKADWTAIAALKAAVTDVPVLGNGDIWVAADAREMVRQTGCDGVVVGRGCLGRPWLFRDLADAFAGRAVAPSPALGFVRDAMRAHAGLLADAFGEAHGLRDFRKHTSWYLTGYAVGGARRRAFSSVTTLLELDALLADLDPDLELPPGGERFARGHTHGPRRVELPYGWLDDRLDPTAPEEFVTAVSGG